MTRIIGIIGLLAAISLQSLWGRSLEWQKIDLEQAIEEKYTLALSAALDRSQFLVKAQVRYSDPGMPDFQDLNSNRFKISDLQFDDSKGDYIAFSKVGLEVPVIGNFREENQQRLKELYRYNESFDLFKNIDSISVKVSVSDRVTEEEFEIVKNLAQSLNYSAGGFVPQVIVEKTKMTPAPIEELEQPGIEKPEPETAEETLGLKDILEMIGRFGNAFGLIMAVAILGFLAFKLLAKYMEFMERLKGMEAKITSKSENKEEDSEKKPGAPWGADADSGASGEDELDQATFERFEKLLELNPKQAATLVKKWIAQDQESAALALSGVAQQLEHDGMEKVLQGLSVKDRQAWNGRILGYLEPEQLKEANKAISQGVVKELVGGAYIDDVEVFDIILSMDSDSIRDYIERGKFGPALVNLLNPDVVADILNELSPEEVGDLVRESLDFDFSALMDKVDEFKKDLRVFAGNASLNPFNGALMKIVAEVNPEKEAILYRQLAKRSKLSEIVKLAKKNLPSELALELPPELLKLVMGNYPMERKVNLLASLTEDDRDKLMGAFLEPGSNAEAMIQMELEVLASDQLRMRRIQNEREANWKSFLSFVRSAIASNDEFAGEVELLVQDWVKNFEEAYSNAA